MLPRDWNHCNVYGFIKKAEPTLLEHFSPIKTASEQLPKAKHLFIIIFVALCWRKLPKFRHIIGEEGDCDLNNAAAASAVLNFPLRRIQAKSPVTSLLL